MMLISPLQTLSAVPHNDVRQKQLDCVGQVRVCVCVCVVCVCGVCVCGVCVCGVCGVCVCV